MACDAEHFAVGCAQLAALVAGSRHAPGVRLACRLRQRAEPHDDRPERRREDYGGVPYRENAGERLSLASAAAQSDKLARAAVAEERTAEALSSFRWNSERR